jgi:hypothetical protein
MKRDQPAMEHKHLSTVKTPLPLSFGSSVLEQLTTKMLTGKFNTTTDLGSLKMDIKLRFHCANSCSFKKNLVIHYKFNQIMKP